MSDSPKKIIINHVPQTLHSDLKNISDNMGIGIASFVKNEIAKAVANMPASLKLPRNKD